MTGLLPLYLRKEPTTDAILLDSVANHGAILGRKRHRDVVAYRDPECTQRAGRWSWWHTQSRPDRRKRYVMLNCYRWRAVWLPDA